MDAYWSWCWSRFGRRYSWAAFASFAVTILPVLVTSTCLVVGVEGGDAYVEATVLGLVATLIIAAVLLLPGTQSSWGLIERWPGGSRAPALATLEQTYRFTRGSVRRGVLVWALATGLALAGTGTAAGAPAGRVLQYGINGAGFGIAIFLIAVHSYAQTLMRPVRRSVTQDGDVGDDLPREHPTFATWSTISLMATIWAFAYGGAMFGGALDLEEVPGLASGIAALMLFGFGIPITLAAAFAPSMEPLRDLASATRRVSAGDFTSRLPVLQDDDLGVLSASFNQMQEGLVERQRLQTAFGSYVDPSLAERLLRQGTDLFSGERVEVTVMFVDIRGFTSFAEASTAEETVAHLNGLFEIVVGTANRHGGHVNKFLGDGAMVVFGAPELVQDHADRAVRAAVDIQRLTSERFGGATRIGIGINTGPVIAGTIGGAGKLEFTLIGDAVNVAARIEQLTKVTDDLILLTKQTADALTRTAPRFDDRGTHDLKGKTEAVLVLALDPFGADPA